MKYRVGDRVRLTEEGVRKHANVSMTDDVTTATTGTVTCVYDEGSGTLVRFNGVRYPAPPWRHEGWGIAAEDLVPAESTPRIDPSIITRLNEVVTMLKREKRRMSQRMGGLREYTTTDSDALRRYWEASNERDNIVARIEAVTKAIDELMKD